MMNDVRERVTKVVAQTLKLNEAAMSDDSRFVEDLGAESMQSVELIAAFEEEFDIEIDEQEAMDVITVGKAVDFIKGQLG